MTFEELFEEWRCSDERLYIFDWGKEGNSWQRELVLAAYRAGRESMKEEAAKLCERHGAYTDYVDEFHWCAKDIRELK